MQEFGDIADKSKSAGLDAEFFQGLAYQAQLAGIGIDQLSAALNVFNKNSGEAIEGRGQLVGALKAENSQLLENIRNADTQAERVRIAADAIDRATSSAEKAALATAFFGDAGIKLTAAFEGGAAAIDATMEKARELGIIIDRETIARADELGDKFDTVTMILDTQFKSAIIELAPFLVNFAANIADIVRGLGDFIDRFRDIKDLSRGALEQRLTRLGAEDLAMENALFDYRSRAGEFGVSTVIESLERKRANNQAEQRAILARLAELGDTPEITVRGGGDEDDDGDLPPLADPAARAALKEAEALMKRLRTASEEYAATVADLDSKREAGLIGQETYNRALAEAVVKFAGAADTTDDYARALARLDEAKARGILTEKQYTAAVEDLTKRRLTAQNDWLAGLQLGLLQIKQNTDDVANDIAGAVTGWADSLSEQIGNVFRTGKFEWRDLINTMLADVARITTQQMIVRPIANLISGAFGGGLGSVGLGGGGGIGAFAGVGGAVGGLAAGTDFWRGGPTWVGERGPELVNLPRGAQVIPNHKLGGMSVSVELAPTYQISGSGLSAAQLRAVMEDNNRLLLEAVPGVVQQAIRNGAFG